MLNKTVFLVLTLITNMLIHQVFCRLDMQCNGGFQIQSHIFNCFSPESYVVLESLSNFFIQNSKISFIQLNLLSQKDIAFQCSFCSHVVTNPQLEMVKPRGLEKRQLTDPATFLWFFTLQMSLLAGALGTSLILPHLPPAQMYVIWSWHSSDSADHAINPGAVFLAEDQAHPSSGPHFVLLKGFVVDSFYHQKLLKGKERMMYSVGLT